MKFEKNVLEHVFQIYFFNDHPHLSDSDISAFCYRIHIIFLPLIL